MAQVTTGIRGVLSSPAIYEGFQKALGADSARRGFVEQHVRPLPHQKVLDIGCGTAELLTFLPESIDYVGYDVSDRYIDYAKNKFGNRGKFHTKIFDTNEAAATNGIDIAMAIGLLHHLDDDEAIQLMRDVKTSLGPGGRFIAMDPCYEKGQNRIAKMLIDMDRGQNVRTQADYHKLASTVFTQVDSTVKHKRWIPYTHHILECT